MRGGSTEMVGTTAACAPWCSSRAIVEPDCSLVRGTSTSQPNSGLVSNHDSVSRMVTVDPTTASTGKRPSAIVADAAPRVVTTVRCSVLVPRSVTATGVSASRPAATRASSDLGGAVGLAQDDDGDARVDRTGEVVAPRTGDDDVHAGRRARGQRHPGVRRHRGDRADAGHDLEGEAGLDAGRGLLGQAVEHGRVAVHEAHDEAAGVGLGGPHDELGPHRVGEPLAVVAVAGVDDVDVGAAPALHDGVTGDLVDDDRVGGREQLTGAHGEQARVAGAGADEDDAGRDPGGGGVDGVDEREGLTGHAPLRGGRRWAAGQCRT